MKPLRSPYFTLGVAVASFATIALELLLTRIYSVTMYYHFAFMVISLALLGLAASGVALYLFPAFFARRSPAFWGAVSMVGFTGGVLLALTVATHNPISLRNWRANIATLIAVYVAAAVPFLCSGLALSAAIASARERIGRIYAVDLGGAALGCLLVIPAIPRLGAPGAIVLVGAVGAGAAALFAAADGGRAMRALAIGAGTLAIALALLALSEPTQHRFGLARNPDKFLGNRPVLFEKWNAFSQITVSPAADTDHRWIFIDADAATRMWSGQVRDGAYQAARRFPEVKVAALVYAIRHDGAALIIGPGGGTDIISALGHGVPKVIGVEVNPTIVNDVMRTTYADWNGDLYRNPLVHIVVDEGRSYIRRTPEKFASIQATLVDTWAASSSGAFTLSENNIYTVEAFSEFLDHLAPGGVLAVTRWYDASAPKEFLRLVALGREAIERRGVAPADVARYFVVATDNDRRGTLLLSRDPYTSADIQRLREVATQDRLRLLFTPDGAPAERGSEDPLFHDFLGAHSAAAFLASQRYDATPTSDDRPFFFYNLRGRQLLSIVSRLGTLEINNLGVAILLFLLLLSIVMTLALVVGPLLLLRRAALQGERRRKLRVLGYFLCLGLGFILVEIGFMQKFVLFLGHPIYALAVVLASLLAASGAGSALSGWGSRRFGVRGFARRVVPALAIVLIGYALLLTPIFHALLGCTLVTRIAIAIVLVALPGLLMGTLLPTGVRVANSVAGDLVPWAWSANGAASVVGSVAATTLSMNLGFTTALFVGILIYALGILVLPDQRTENQTP